MKSRRTHLFKTKTADRKHSCFGILFWQGSSDTDNCWCQSSWSWGCACTEEKWRTSICVNYASRTLSQVEHCYSQTEKEALAIVWACEWFHLYVYGLPEFDLVTDHEALKVIYSSKSKPWACIECWVLCLQQYKYKVCYVPSRKNIADARNSHLLLPSNHLRPIQNH